MNATHADWVSLRIFLATVELGSITRAALRCGIASSAAAKRLQTLEQDCGLRLLDRGARGAKPTAAGEALAQHARALFDLHARFNADLRAFAEGGQGSVRLLATASVIAGHGLGALLATFARAHPGIRVELREHTSTAVLHHLAEGRCDIGLITSFSDVPASLDCFDWRTDRLMVVMPPDHPVERESLRFAEVLPYPIINLQPGGALSLLLADAAQRLGLRFESRFQMEGTDGVRSLVAAGLGVAIMPDALLRPASDLRAVPLHEDWALRQLRLVTRPAEMLPPSARLLREHLRAASARGAH